MWAAQASLYADRKSENRSDGEAMSKDNVVVGFVGLGTMGGCKAANVQRAGFKLIVPTCTGRRPAIILLLALFGRTARVHSQGRPT
jgi:hypothetical protein